ncbi:MAG: CBS domain-containing protein [Myxococcota bacterium]
MRSNAAESVAEVMQKHFVCVAPDDSLLEAEVTMRVARLRELMVLRDGILVGLLTECPSWGDELRALLRSSRAEAQELLRTRKVGDVMLLGPRSLPPGCPLDQAAGELLEAGRSSLPVAVPSPSGPLVIGLLTEGSLLRAAYD